MKVRIDASEINALTRDLDISAGLTEQAIRKSEVKAAERLVEEVRPGVPVDTGALQASGRAAGGDIIWDDLDYASYVEFGTDRMRAQPYFYPIVESRAGEIFAEEASRALAEALRKISG